MPLYVIFIWFRTSKESRLFSSLNWLFIACATISIYLLYALIKGELVPEAWLPEFMRTYQERVTLVDTLRFHLGRGNDLPFWKAGSDFYNMSWSWYDKDPFLVFTVIWSSIAGIIMSIFYKPARFVAGFLAISWWFLLRGGFVIDFYILPIIPFAGIMLGMLFMHFLKLTKIESHSMKFIVTTCFFVVLSSIFLSLSYRLYNINETKPQLDSMEWVKANIPADSKIVIDTALVLDFQNKEGGKTPVAFVDAHPNWKAEKDPEIYNQKLQKDWRNIDYVLLTHETLKQIKNGEFILLDRYIDSADIIAEWENSNSDTFLSVDQRISTNGDWVKLLKLPDEDTLILRDTWREYKKNFLVSYGQIIDPKNNDKTTSEGQSYALMRAAMMNDKKTFDGVWSWTQAKLRNRGSDSLISWLWEKNEAGEYVQTDYSTAADADVDIALSLVLAYELWGEQRYIEDAKEMIRDIWEHEVVAVNGEYYLTFNTTPEKPEGIIINPSYFSPAHYRVFAKYDQTHNWNKLASDTYKQLERLQNFQNNKTNLPPNWVMVTRSGNFISASKYFQNNADYYGFDSFRVVWRVALDARWFGTPEAYNYLYDIQPFYLNNNAQEGLFKSVYKLDGTPVVEYAGLSTDTAFLSLASIINKPAADKYYKEYLSKAYNHNEGYWRDPKHYYDQNWVWFAVALYFNDLTYPININK